MKPKIIDNGSQFGNDHWYTFYCAKCGRIINMNYAKKDRMVCEYCNEPIEYDDKEAPCDNSK